MINNESPKKEQKIPTYYWFYFIWIVIALFFLIMSISLVQNSLEKIFTDKLYASMQANPNDLSLRMAYFSAKDAYSKSLGIVSIKTGVEGLGLLLSVLLIILKEYRSAINIGFVSIILGMILDFIGMNNNILIINIIGFLLILVLNNRYKKAAKQEPKQEVTN